MTASDRMVKAESVKKLREWFVFVAILCSLLAFSGYAESRSPKQSATQTELRASIQNSDRATVPFYGLSNTSTVIVLYQGQGEINTKDRLSHYERNLDVKFLNNVKRWLSYRKGPKVVRTPYTRRSYHESFINSSRG